MCWTGVQAEKRRESGTVLMEAVLCLPLLLMLVTGIVQFTRIWEARLFTQYAAYNAARAALVYNPVDYAYADPFVPGRTEFREHRGPVWQAAVNTLAWKSATENSSSSLLFPGFAPGDRVPNSAAIWGSTNIDRDRSWESNGMVCVTVNFHFPLLFRIFDPSLLVSGGNESGDGDPMRQLNDWATVSLKESCVLPKPWSSAHYPRLSLEESQTLADYQSWGVISGAPSIFGGKEAGE